MRSTRLPLLRDLPSGVVIERCQFCNELVAMGELCQSTKESEGCPSRADVDGCAEKATT